MVDQQQKCYSMIIYDSNDNVIRPRYDGNTTLSIITIQRESRNFSIGIVNGNSCNKIQCTLNVTNDKERISIIGENSFQKYTYAKPSTMEIDVLVEIKAISEYGDSITDTFKDLSINNRTVDYGNEDLWITYGYGRDYVKLPNFVNTINLTDNIIDDNNIVILRAKIKNE